MLRVRLKGQSTLEYVILLGFVVAALIAMGVYMKRGTEGKLRESTDRVGEQFDATKTESSFTTHTYTKQKEDDLADGSSIVTIAGPDQNYSKKQGSETVHSW